MPTGPSSELEPWGYRGDLDSPCPSCNLEAQRGKDNGPSARMKGLPGHVWEPREVSDLVQGVQKLLWKAMFECLSGERGKENQKGKRLRTQSSSWERICLSKLLPFGYLSGTSALLSLLRGAPWPHLLP